MRCPNDGRELTSIEYEGCLVHTCDSCGGELLNTDALGHVVRSREVCVESAGIDGECSAIEGVPAKDLQRGIACPVCAARMQTTIYAGEVPVYIDRCFGCGGVWLDSLELERVQRLSEHWQDRASEQLRAAAFSLETARRNAVATHESAFQGSRFAFVNAVINRLLDAA